MNLRRFVLLCSSALASPGVCVAADAATAFQSRVAPVLQAYCARCHGTEKPKANVNLAGARDLEQLAADPNLWFRVLGQLEAGAMPPEGENQPSAAERQAVVRWVRGEFTELMAARQRQAGRSKLRRLSR